ncbi:MAG: hypothetical protein EBT03_11280 [Betaproteobacteria bacterium]|nr:hypothetical protein [Betaproteobacteria bacterium]NCA17608.1 hypothetical protein [Betaproteobacteria bacterium]
MMHIVSLPSATQLPLLLCCLRLRGEAAQTLGFQQEVTVKNTPSMRPAGRYHPSHRAAQAPRFGRAASFTSFLPLQKAKPLTRMVPIW